VFGLRACDDANVDEAGKVADSTAVGVGSPEKGFRALGLKGRGGASAAVLACLVEHGVYTSACMWKLRPTGYT
jgi:hypothetical protein